VAGDVITLPESGAPAAPRGKPGTTRTLRWQTGGRREVGAHGVLAAAKATLVAPRVATRKLGKPTRPSSKKTHASNFFRCETLTPSTLDGKTEPGDRHALAHASGFADDCRCMVAPGGGDGSVGTGAEVRMGEEPMTASSALGALFLLAIGGEVLAVAYHGFRSGELPAGAKGTARVSPTPRRQSARVQFFPGTVFQRWHGVGSVGLAHPGGHGPTAEVAVIATTTAAVARPERDLASEPSSPDHTGSSRLRCSFADGRTSTAPRLGECDHV